MRRISLWLTATVAIVILLFTYHTSTGGRAGQTVAVGTAAPGLVTTPSTGSTASGSGTDSGSSGSSGGSTSSKQANGTVADTRWGPVQVQVTIADGKITDVHALIYPNGNGRDAEINSYALPQLRQQVLAAQSANIQGVSGATVTSDGYRESLQAALDAAHFTG